MAKQAMGEKKEQTRRGRPLAVSGPAELNPWYENSWAVVIGINNYKDPGIGTLKHAVNDARGMAGLLINHLGFPANQVFVILDPLPAGFPGTLPGDPPECPHLSASGTKAEIEQLLLTDLPALVKPDDRLLVFYAGHGERRPVAKKEEGIGYLVPSDAESGKWHTFVEMSALTQLLNLSAAKHIFYLLDCCYSGLATARGTPAVSDFTDVSLRNRALECLTAGTARQAVDDDGPEGHSTFTWTVIQGLKKEADWNNDDIITGTDLMVYVKNRLIDSYGKLQTPDFGYLQGHESGGDFIFRLPRYSARDYFDLAVKLCHLGHKTGIPGSFESALGYLEMTLDLARNSGISLPEAELWKGKTLLDLDRAGEAGKVLTRLVAGEVFPPESWFWLGLARAQLKDYTGAAAVFTQLLTTEPSFEHALWINHYITWMGGEGRSRKRALLIGINKYQAKEFHELNGCINDVRLVKSSLEKKFGFDPQDITLLEDEVATTRAITGALTDLAAQSASGDTVIVHFSGHSIPSEEDPTQVNTGDPYLVSHDALYDSRKKKMTGGISAGTLHQWVNAIPSAAKTLILDTHPSSIFIKLSVPERNYAVINAAYPGEITYESLFDLGEETVYAGLLSGAIAETLTGTGSEKISLGELMEGVIRSIRKKGFDQNPFLIGNPGQLFCGREEKFMNLWKLSCQQSFVALNDEFLISWYTQVKKEPELTQPVFMHAFGRAFLEKKMVHRAAGALLEALQSDTPASQAIRLDLVRAYARLGRFGMAESHFREFAASAGQEVSREWVSQLAALLERSAQGRKHALLVGIDHYQNPEITPLKGAVHDVHLMKETLVNHCGFLPGEITLLVNEEATAGALLDAFDALAAKAKEEAAFFYFAGYGSRDADGLLTLMSYEGRDAGNFDIGLEELAARIPAGPTNLVTILDAGLALSPGADPALRTWRSDLRVISKESSKERKTLHTAGNDGENESPPLIGCLTVYSRLHPTGTLNPFDQPSEAASSPRKKKPAEADFSGSHRNKNKIHGELTWTLTEQIGNQPDHDITYADWIHVMKRKMESGTPEIIGEASGEPPFIAHATVAEILEWINRLENLPLLELISALQKMAERKEKDPSLFLDLGLAFAAVEDWEKSRRYLTEATELADESPDPGTGGGLNGVPSAEVRWQAHYHLGRILYERKTQLGKAVEELRKARELHPGDPRINYYFGQAIRAFVERETLAEATEAFREYIDSGAPLGRKTEIMQFIRSRKEGR